MRRTACKEQGLGHDPEEGRARERKSMTFLDPM
jgi:hypothetical protein